MSALVDHIDHICQLAGNSEHAGIGSDLDGGYGTEQTPCGLQTIADLQKLAPLLAARGYVISTSTTSSTATGCDSSAAACPK